MAFIVAFLSISGYVHAQDTGFHSIIKELMEIDRMDQLYRNQLEGVRSKFGGDSKEIRELVKNMSVADSFNLIRVSKILSLYGWPGSTIIGDQANTAIFMVIQHSDVQTQIKYLPLMRDAVANGNAKGRQLALLEDRVALRQGKPQLYGSQVSWNMKTNEMYLAPMADPDDVDKRRAAVGLSALADYLKDIGLTWNLEQYKKDLPEIEKVFFHTDHTNN